MSDTAKDKEKGLGGVGIALGALMLFLLPMLYLLSIGPAAMFYHYNNDGPEWLADLYYPIMKLSEAVPAIEPLLEWYIELFVDPNS